MRIVALFVAKTVTGRRGGDSATFLPEAIVQRFSEGD
jgi:hypothetical protein